MDDVEYERCRHAKAIEWGIRLETLDRMRKQAKQRAGIPADSSTDTQPDPNDLEDRLRPILDTEGILDLWLQSWDKVMAGEHRNAKLLYLIATSRLFDKCMHVAIKGPSSGGKSRNQKTGAGVFSRRGHRHLHHDVGEGAALSRGRLLSQNFVDGRGERLPRTGASRHAPARTDERGQAQLSGRAEDQRPARHDHHRSRTAPSAFMVTTTKAALHPENETRMLSLEIDDSEEQTRRVLKKLAQTHRQEHQAR